MAKAQVYNQKGEKVKEVTLPKQVFEIEVSPTLVQQAVVTQLANSRVAIADTKGRSEVRGGGKKPWKQKGTGRARHGSIRSPLWVGGGITFGPTKERNFSKGFNKKAKTKALLMVLSDKAKSENMLVIDELKIKAGKSKELVEIYQALPNKEKKAVIVLDKKDANVSRAAKNIPYLSTLPVDSLNVVDLLGFELMIISEKSIKQLVKKYATKE